MSSRTLQWMMGCALGATAMGAVGQGGAPAEIRLGNFSVSLNVKNLSASREFYEKLGFKVVSGDAKQNWLVLQHGSTKVGIFQGMFPRNMMTFNPGWDSNGKAVAEFDDVREIQKQLKARGLVLDASADDSSTGPAHVMLTDPDGNPILIDQHVAKPKK